MVEFSCFFCVSSSFFSPAAAAATRVALLCERRRWGSEIRPDKATEQRKNGEGFSALGSPKRKEEGKMCELGDGHKKWTGDDGERERERSLIWASSLCECGRWVPSSSATSPSLSSSFPSVTWRFFGEEKKHGFVRGGGGGKVFFFFFVPGARWARGSLFPVSLPYPILTGDKESREEEGRRRRKRNGESRLGGENGRRQISSLFGEERRSSGSKKRKEGGWVCGVKHVFDGSDTEGGKGSPPFFWTHSWRRGVKSRKKPGEI